MRELEWEVTDPRLQLVEGSVRACVASLDRCAKYPVRPGCLNIAFVDPESCRRLHAAFFDDPDLTDVMTFPGDPEDELAGDVAICPEMAARQCTETGFTFADELTLYLVHAWLHLAGLEDASTEGAAEMRKAESFLMRHLRLSESRLQAAWLA